VDSKRLGALEAQLTQVFHGILKKRLASVRIRCHGDMTLYRFLSTGSDFILTDWSGPPEGAFGDRRIKRSPLRDVASMINSFRRAATQALNAQLSSGEVTMERWPLLEAGAAAWYAVVATRFFKSYRENLNDSGFGLGNAEEVDLLLTTHLLEKILDDMAATLGAPDALVMKNLSDLLDALQSLAKPAPGAASWDGAWPEARAWTKLLTSAKAAPLPPGTPSLDTKAATP
jgi:maltose alpha-D-glucosyltransferase/alpha-amylase